MVWAGESWENLFGDILPCSIKSPLHDYSKQNFLQQFCRYESHFPGQCVEDAVPKHSLQNFHIDFSEPAQTRHGMTRYMRRPDLQ